MKEILIRILKERNINFDNGEANYIDDNFDSVYESYLMAFNEVVFTSIGKHFFDKEQDYLKATLNEMEKLGCKFPMGGVFHNLEKEN